MQKNGIAPQAVKERDVGGVVVLEEQKVGERDDERTAQLRWEGSSKREWACIGGGGSEILSLAASGASVVDPTSPARTRRTLSTSVWKRSSPVWGLRWAGGGGARTGDQAEELHAEDRDEGRDLARRLELVPQPHVLRRLREAAAQCACGDIKAPMGRRCGRRGTTSCPLL